MNRFACVLPGPLHSSAHSRPSPSGRSPHRASPFALAAVSVLALAAGGSVSAAESPLTLAEAQRLAILHSKRLEASDLALTASKDLAVAAAERPDPVAKVGLENLPIDGPERFSV